MKETAVAKLRFFNSLEFDDWVWMTPLPNNPNDQDNAANQATDRDPVRSRTNRVPAPCREPSAAILPRVRSTRGPRNRTSEFPFRLACSTGEIRWSLPQIGLRQLEGENTDGNVDVRKSSANCNCRDPSSQRSARLAGRHLQTAMP